MTLNHTTQERSVVRRLIKDALSAGYMVSLNDGEEWSVRRSTRLSTIMADIQSTDVQELLFRKTGDVATFGEANSRVWVQLVYGNSPWEVICDHTDTPEARKLLSGADKLMQKYEEKHYRRPGKRGHHHDIHA